MFSKHSCDGTTRNAGIQSPRGVLRRCEELHLGHSARLSRRRVAKPCDDAEQRCLAGSGRTEQRDEFALFHIEADVSDCLENSAAPR